MPVMPFTSFRSRVVSNRNHARRSASSIHLNQAGAGDVVVLVAKGMRLTQLCSQLAVVVSQLGKHVERRNKMCDIVENTLQARYLANRAKRGATNLPNTFGDRICGRKDLIGLLIQELVIVAKMWAGDVPMEVLGFQVKGKHISKQNVECGANVPRSVSLEVRGRAERSHLNAALSLTLDT